MPQLAFIPGLKDRGSQHFFYSRTGQLITVLRGHTDDVTNAIFSPDGEKLLTMSKDGNVRRWNLSGDPALIKLPTNSTQSNEKRIGLNYALFAPDVSSNNYTILTYSISNPVISPSHIDLWNVRIDKKTGKTIKSNPIEPPEKNGYYGTFSPKNNYLAFLSREEKITRLTVVKKEENTFKEECKGLEAHTSPSSLVYSRYPYSRYPGSLTFSHEGDKIFTTINLAIKENAI